MALAQRGQMTAHGINLSYPAGWFMVLMKH
jgi:hypothetical protein